MKIIIESINFNSEILYGDNGMIEVYDSSINVKYTLYSGKNKLSGQYVLPSDAENKILNQTMEIRKLIFENIKKDMST